jgi:hypothetical protein
VGGVSELTPYLWSGGGQNCLIFEGSHAVASSPSGRGIWGQDQSFSCGVSYWQNREHEERLYSLSPELILMLQL